VDSSVVELSLRRNPCVVCSTSGINERTWRGLVKGVYKRRIARSTSF